MINWKKRKENLRNRIYKQRTEKGSHTEFSNELADWYDETIKSGQDAQYGNSVLKVNKNILERSVREVLSTTQETGLAFESALATGITGYWTGAQLEMKVPPPGSSQVIINTVTDPGQFAYTLPDSENQEFSIFLSSLITSIKAHLKTIKGLTKAQTGQAVVDYPWVGYI